MSTTGSSIPPAQANFSFSDFPYLINNNFYDFRVCFITSNGYLKFISNESIKSFVLEDDLSSPFHRGYIILSNNYDSIENVPKQKVSYNQPSYYNSSGTTPQSQKTSPFILNGDSRDIIRVYILPKLSDSNHNTKTNESDDIKKYFLLDFEFTVYNEEDVKGDNLDEKFKKFYLREFVEEVLIEKNSYFSTSNLLNKENIEDLNNEERGVLTGTALSAAIVNSLPEEEGFQIKIGEFEPGSSSLFFSSPANYKCCDVIKFIHERHVSDANCNHDSAILRYERSPREFTLKSYTNYFKKAVQQSSGTDGSAVAYPGELMLETFKLVGFNDDDSAKIESNSSTIKPEGIPYLRTVGNVSTYSYDNMAGDFSQKHLVPSIIHFYSYNDKEFQADVFRNSMEETFTVYKDNYVSPITKSGTATFLPGDYRTTNKNLNNVFANIETSADQRLSLGRSKFLSKSIYLNNLMTFRVLGSTHRQSGKFIVVTRDTSYDKTAFDDKLLGVYFIINTKHIFDKSTTEYYNELVCVKTYYNTDLFVNKNIL